MSILAAESDRLLYGGNVEVIDSPMPVQPSSQSTPIDEPISIAIPQSTNPPHLPNRTEPPALQPMTRPMTVAQPSSAAAYVSSCTGERQIPSTVASYDQSKCRVLTCSGEEMVVWVVLSPTSDRNFWSSCW